MAVNNFKKHLANANTGELKVKVEDEKINRDWRSSALRLDQAVDKDRASNVDITTILPRGLPHDLHYQYGKYFVERRQSLRLPRGAEDEFARLLPFLPFRTASDNDNLHNMPKATMKETDRHFINLEDVTEAQKEENYLRTQLYTKRALEFQKEHPEAMLLHAKHMEQKKAQYRRKAQLAKKPPTAKPKKDPDLPKKVPSPDKPLKPGETPKPNPTVGSPTKPGEKKQLKSPPKPGKSGRGAINPPTTSKKKTRVHRPGHTSSEGSSDESGSDSSSSGSGSSSSDSSSDDDMMTMMMMMMMMQGQQQAPAPMPIYIQSGGGCGGYPSQYYGRPAPGPRPQAYGECPCGQPTAKSKSKKKPCRPKTVLKKNQGMNFDFLPHDNCCTEVTLTIEPDDPDPLECAIDNGIMPIVCCYMPPSLTLDPRSPLGVNVAKLSADVPDNSLNSKSRPHPSSVPNKSQTEKFGSVHSGSGSGSKASSQSPNNDVKALGMIRSSLLPSRPSKAKTKESSGSSF